MRYWHHLVVFIFVIGVSLSGCGLTPAVDGGTGQTSAAVTEPEGVTKAEPMHDGDHASAPVPEDHFYMAMHKLTDGNLVGARALLVLHAATGNPIYVEEARLGTALLDLLEQGPGMSTSSTLDSTSERILLLQSVLRLVDALEGDLIDLNDRNQALSLDLDKREEALKRLRELTLGQPEG
ncbi:MAG: hypothetical protein P8M73_09755 [Luminiphilus sp.]|nr:hypothetical protein [Luminiphilus sp.]